MAVFLRSGLSKPNNNGGTNSIDAPISPAERIGSVVVNTADVLVYRNGQSLPYTYNRLNPLFFLYTSDVNGNLSVKGSLFVPN